jgi:hypothetical protein
MKQPQDDNQLRELLQRVKQADGQHAPTFDSVMTRSAQESQPGGGRRRQLTVGACVVAALLVALFVRTQLDVTPTDGGSSFAVNPTRSMMVPPDASNDNASNEGLVTIDFDELLKSVDDHLPMADFDTEDMSVWSSRTDSLLALNVNVPLSDQNGSR